MSTVELARLTSQALRGRLREDPVLFVPFGTLEAHGMHLPVSTDTICADGIALQLAREFKGLMAPALPYGITNQLFNFPVASRFRTETYSAFVREMLESFIRQGFRRFVLVNGHGGNVDVLQSLTRDLAAEQHVGVCAVHWWYPLGELIREHFGGSGGHALAEETAAALHFTPDWVRAELYGPDTRFLVTPGIYACPPPAASLAYKEDFAEPVFEPGNAATFMEKVLALLTEKLRPIIRGWERL